MGRTILLCMILSLPKTSKDVQIYKCKNTKASKSGNGDDLRK